MNNKEVVSESYRKVILNGTTLTISIPRDVREIVGIKKGDRIKVVFLNDKVNKEDIEKKEIIKKKEVVKESSEELPVIPSNEEIELPEIE